MDIREAIFYTILLDLHKAYANLERDRCLNILAGYGVGLLMLWILWTY